MPNQEPASVWIFGNGSVRVGTQGLFRPYLKTFVAPILSTRLTAPGSPRMCFHLPSCKSAGWICWNYRWECSQCRVRVRVTHRSWFTWSSSWRNVAGSSRRMIRENTRPSSLWTPYWKKTATFPQSYANLADCGVRSGDMARLVSLLVRFELTLYRTPLTLLSCWKKYSACYGESILKTWGFLGPKKTKCPAVRKFLEFLQKPFFLMVWKSSCK